jgi:integrase
MPTKDHLQRRRHVWYVRLMVPTPLQPTMGRRELIRTTGTRDHSEAKRRSPLILAALQRELATARQGAAPSMADAGYLAWYAQQTHGYIAKGLLTDDSAADNLDIATDRVIEHLASVHGVDAEGYPKIPEEHVEAIRRAPQLLDPNAVLLSTAITEYLAETAQRVTKSTNVKQALHLKSFADWLKVDREVSEVTRKLAGRYVAETLVTSTRALRTRKEHVVTLSGFWTWLDARGICEGANPWRGLRKTIKESTRGGLRTRKRPFTVSELTRLLTEVLEPGTALLPMVCVAAYTGLRIDELASLKVEHVAGDALRVVGGKNDNAVRTVPLHPAIKPMVAALVGSTTDAYLIPGLTTGGTDSKRSFYCSKTFGNLLRTAGFPKGELDFHSLRRSFAQRMEQAGVPTPTAELLMGHERTSMTFGLYSQGIDLDGLALAVGKVTYGVTLEAAVTTLAKVATVTERARRRLPRTTAPPRIKRTSGASP